MYQLCAGPLSASQPLQTLVPSRPVSVSPSPPSPFLVYRDTYRSCLSPFLPLLPLLYLPQHPWSSLPDPARQPHLDPGQVSCHLVTFCSLQKEQSQSLFHLHPYAPVGPIWTQDALPASSTEPHPGPALASSASCFSQQSAETWVRQPPI